ncbi:hypothetical protein ACEQ8H_008805 [Pleosporales sp. CAS-2024a]
MEARSRIPVGPPAQNPLPSYWHNPKSPLANLIEPETDNPTCVYDYLIIGSGISGTMIAYNLFKSQPKARIVMLEAREACSGATGRNGGHTKAASYRGYLEHVQELGKEEALKIARMEYANIMETHALARTMAPNCESAVCETVDVMYDADSFELGKTAIAALYADATEEEKKEGQMAHYTVHSATPDILERFHIAPPSSSTTTTMDAQTPPAGLFSYTAGRIHAYRFTTSVLSHCVSQYGLVLCTKTPVHKILPSSPGGASTSTPTPETETWDVHTQHATFSARHVVLATNGYTPYLLPATQGVLVPMRGHMTAQRPGRGNKLSTPLRTTYSFIYRGGYDYMIPRPLSGGGGQDIVIGGGLGRLQGGGEEEYGTVDDTRLNVDISSYLGDSLVSYFGAENWGAADQTREERVVQEWTGIMGATADGRPFVGQVPGMQGVWLSAGFNGHGMVLCLKSAEALATMLLGNGVPEWFPESFLINEERLKKKREFGGRTDLQGPSVIGR